MIEEKGRIELGYRGRHDGRGRRSSSPPLPLPLLSPPSASHPIPPPRGQMGVPAYVKAALCSAHPRSAICQCQGASAVSMETPPASRQRRKRASEHERVNEPSGAVGDPPVLRDYHPAGTTQPPGFHHHSAARLPPFRRHPPPRTPARRMPTGRPATVPRFATLADGGASGRVAFARNEFSFLSSERAKLERQSIRDRLVLRY